MSEGRAASHRCPSSEAGNGAWLLAQLSLHIWSTGVSAEAEISRLPGGPCEQKIAEDLVAVSFQDVQE